MVVATRQAAPGYLPNICDRLIGLVMHLCLDLHPYTPIYKYCFMFAPKGKMGQLLSVSWMNGTGVMISTAYSIPSQTKAMRSDV